jgi:Matrixin.
MKRVAVSLLSLAVGAMPFVALHGSRSIAATLHTAIASGPSTANGSDSRHTSVVGGAIGRALDIIAADDTWDDEREEARRRLRDGQAGTYIGDILNERDSSVARWPDRHGIPLTVWIQPHSDVPDFTPALVASVRNAFLEWGTLGLPVQFAFFTDSSRADVHVTWIDHFTQPISGRTRWSRDDNWLITDANVVLAVHHSQGDVLDEDSMRAMALHEIGHLLGLDHTQDATSIMAPLVRARALSDADRATVRLVYALPAGPLR